MPAPTVAFELYESIYRYLEHAGFSEQELHQRLAVKSRRDYMRNGRIPLSLYEQAFLAAEDITQDSTVGMRIGSTVFPSSIGVFYFLTVAGGNITQIMAAVSRYFPLAYDFIALDLCPGDDVFCIRFQYHHRHRPHRHVVEHLMTNWFCLANQLTFDAQNVPRTLYFQHPFEGDPAVLESIFRTTPVRFSQEDDRFDLQQDGLHYHTSQTNPQLFSLSEKKAAHLLLRLRSRDRIAQEISSHVTRLLADGLPSIDAVAQRMNCSGRTLQRRLAERNLNYQMLLDNIRKDIAIELLSTTRLPVTHIAQRTGFADDSTFHRAFKRWTGVSPGAYRH